MKPFLLGINLFLLSYVGSPSVPLQQGTATPLTIIEEAKNLARLSLQVPIESSPLPEEALEYRFMTATGYSSTPEETDDTPFHTATGQRVKWGIIATNDLPFGTKVRLPDLFADQIFIVDDRMHSRFTGRGRIDIWFPSKKEALHFGIWRDMIVEVIERPQTRELVKSL